MPTHRPRRARAYVRARLKALAAGIGAFVTFAVTALLLAPEVRDTVTGFVPEPLRPVVALLFVVGTAWAVERTRNRPDPAESE